MKLRNSKRIIPLTTEYKTNSKFEELTTLITWHIDIVGYRQA